ncbi:MAG: hypothetical protein ACXWEW_03325 [Nitrososphaeraceae archaeon]
MQILEAKKNERIEKVLEYENSTLSSFYNIKKANYYNNRLVIVNVVKSYMLK